MGSGEDKPRRSFINRYWVLIVIVLWLIAWSARDWLAPAEPEDPPGDSGIVLEGEPRAGDEEAAREEAAREEAAREEAAREEATEEPVEVGALLTGAREAYWREGAAAAMTILEEGLETRTFASRERADILGELGNLQYATGDIGAAMDSWDRALETLPEAERGAMIGPLRPVYARHHPQGADHLERFR